MATALCNRWHGGHGHTKTPTHRTWIGMRSRCTNPNDKRYASYGGRGIKVCERWNDFTAFLADMGEKPAGLTIERIDNDKGYEPGNCKWATYDEQNRNTRRNKNIAYNGRTMCLQDWAREIGITWPGLEYRLKVWPVEQALTRKVAR